jgi:hypothetical protein
MRRSWKRSAAALALCAALAGGLSAEGAAAGSLPNVKVSKKPDGPFRAGVLQVGVKEKRNLYVRVKNQTNHKQDVSISEQCGGVGCANLDVKWFRGDKDVSHSVQAGANGLEFKLKPDKPAIFRVRVIPETANPSACLYPLVSLEMGTPFDEAYFGVNGNLCN